MSNPIPTLENVEARLEQRTNDIDFLRKLRKLSETFFSDSGERPVSEDIVALCPTPLVVASEIERVEGQLSLLRRQKKLSAEQAAIAEKLAPKPEPPTAPAPTPTTTTKAKS